MADDNRATPAGWGPIWAGAAVAACLAGTAYFGYRVPAAGTTLVFIGAIAGICFGKYHPKLDDKWLPKSCGLTADDLTKVGNHHDFVADSDKDTRSPPYKEGYFLLFSTIFIGLYILFFLWCGALNLPSYREFERVALGFPIAPPLVNGEPLPPALQVKLDAATLSAFRSYLVICGTTAGVVGVLAFHAGRHALFVRMITLLGGAVRMSPKPHKVIRKLKVEVFRYDQFYEPAGNVFVTVGIMGTFLGLAVGLATINLSDLANGIPLAMVTTLKSLITCMGFGLGVSLLGVILALLSQGLRGHGPRRSTEDLLDEAARALNENSRKRGNKATTTTTVTQPETA